MRRRILASLSGKALPYDAEVEWISSPELGPFIDTGIMPDGNFGMEAEFTWSNGNNAFVFGSMWGSASSFGNYFSFGLGTSSNTVCLFRYGSLEKNFVYVMKDGYLYSIKSRAGHLIFKYPGGEGSWDFQKQEITQREAFKIGEQYPFDGIANFRIPKLHRFALHDGTDFVFDSKPVRFTNSLGQTEGAMYDRVSGQLFRNAGTGAFVIGPDKA